MSGNSISHIEGQIVDIHERRIFPGEVKVEHGKISSIREKDVAAKEFILPGFIDAHVHIESSMLVPTEFARMAVVHGTIATVSDPHEIANVLGVSGVRYMIENAAFTPFHFCFGAPSCVPATGFETAGAEINEHAIQELLELPEIGYLAEVMNFPGVLSRDPSLMAKIAHAKKAGKPIDGHAPGLRGNDAKRYADAGISTDHECFTKEEALDKLAAGMKIIIREGSAAKNFEALIPLMNTHPEKLMFCSDDKHPDDLIQGHINKLVSRAIKAKFDLFDVLRSASVNPASHYGLPVGLLREGDRADFIIASDLENFEILETVLGGNVVSRGTDSYLPKVKPRIVNRFNCKRIEAHQLAIHPKTDCIRTIDVLDGELITEQGLHRISDSTKPIQSSPEYNLLKIVVVNRYQPAKPAIGFVRNFGLRKGALASSVAHDSHNIIAVGVSDEDLAEAVNLVIHEKGGVAFFSESHRETLALPIAGLMSPLSGTEVGRAYEKLDQLAKEHGSILRSPYMTLSFLALLVIPKLKLSDQGLFDGEGFEFVDLFHGSDSERETRSASYS